MEEEQELVTCQNCQQKFPSFKIDLHEAYCRRNIKRCKLCNKMVDVNQQENQFHAEKPCQYCNQSILVTQMPTHILNCQERPVECKHCQNPFPFSSIQRHQEQCGSRTKRCDICRKYIKVRQYQQHIAHCQIQEVQRNQSSQLRRNQPYPMGHNRQRMNSNDKIKKQSTKQHLGFQLPKQAPAKVIGREPITQLVDPVPISVRLTIQRQKQKKANK